MFFVFNSRFLPVKITKIIFAPKNGKIAAVEYSSVIQSYTRHGPFRASSFICNLIAFTL